MAPAAVLVGNLDTPFLSVYPRAGLSFYTVIDCHWLSFIRDLHSDLAIISCSCGPNDRPTLGYLCPPSPRRSRGRSVSYILKYISALVQTTLTCPLWRPRPAQSYHVAPAVGLVQAAGFPLVAPYLLHQPEFATGAHDGARSLSSGMVSPAVTTP
jgi:hypothetical protein